MKRICLDLSNFSRAKTLHDSEKCLELNSVRDDTPSITQQVIPADDNVHKEAMLKWLLQNQGDCENTVSASNPSAPRRNRCETRVRRNSM